MAHKPCNSPQASLCRPEGCASLSGSPNFLRTSARRSRAAHLPSVAGSRKSVFPSSGDPPLVYVIVLNFNNWTDTAECLDSLMVLDYTNYRLLVVDNGSSELPSRDSTAHLPSLVFLWNFENLGFSRGNNRGIRYALQQGADYVWLLNNDTRVEPRSLKVMIETAEQDPHVGAVGSILLKEHGERTIEAWGGGQVNLLSGLPSHLQGKASGRLDYLCGASLLLRREALEDVGALDEGFFLYWEDTDLCFRLRAHGWKLAVAETASITHKRSSSSVFQSTLYDYHFTASSIRFFRRHARLWLLPSLISVAGRMACRILSAKRANAKAVWDGFVFGLSRGVEERGSSVMKRNGVFSHAPKS
jgi:GT2 family glycosyltransferase